MKRTEPKIIGSLLRQLYMLAYDINYVVGLPDLGYGLLTVSWHPSAHSPAEGHEKLLEFFYGIVISHAGYIVTDCSFPGSPIVHEHTVL